MFDKSCLKEVLLKYKEDFLSYQWVNEKYKWEALKCFQDNWNINDSDFEKMICNSFAKTDNLLTSSKNFPANMIKIFAKVAPEKVRLMYVELFDESKDVTSRISYFKHKSSNLLELYGNGAKQHYQHENAISTYLWLRYPDKYYIYKYNEIKSVADKLCTDLSFKKGSYEKNIRNFYSFYDEICDEIRKDNELTSLFKSQLTDTCYLDLEYKTLTSDIGFYISRFYFEKDNLQQYAWFPMDYSPELKVKDWVNLLKDEEVFTSSSLEIMKRIKDCGGQATCTQLSLKYGEKKNFYNSGSSSLAQRIVKKTGCPVMNHNIEDSRWWPILYVGRKARKNEEGSYMWKLRDELSEALDMVDLSRIKLYANLDKDMKEPGYWWLNANPKIWSFSDISVGEIQSYTLYNENGNKRRIFKNFLEAKKGDMVILYESNPVKQIVAIGRISAEQDGEQIYFEKVESLISPISYSVLKKFPEIDKMEYFTNQQGSLFKLTNEEYYFIYDIIREENPIISEEKLEKYSKYEFFNEVYMSENTYNKLIFVIRNKKNIILQGAPGVGKTFTAKRLAYSMMGEKDDSRVEFVQFHQSYSYEDFMMGYKPVNDGFELKYGIFYRFCQKALNQSEKEHFFIIDEINRGNMSKIFGELLMLIESDYRGTKATLAYNGLSFTVPKNVYIIGMMNTADRSLAMIDYALRRRFSFFDIEPGFSSEGFIRYKDMLNNEMFSTLVSKVEELNKEITLDKSLGNGFCIGHSYFCGQTKCDEQLIESIIDYDIIPMLREYWFDDTQKLKWWENSLQGVLNDKR